MIPYPCRSPVESASRMCGVAGVSGACAVVFTTTSPDTSVLVKDDQPPLGGSSTDTIVHGETIMYGLGSATAVAECKHLRTRTALMVRATNPMAIIPTRESLVDPRPRLGQCIFTQIGVPRWDSLPRRAEPE
jgi:hypothetical protein